MRNAIAETYVALQFQSFRSLRKADLQIVEIQLDETEVPANIDFPGEVGHIMVIHVVITRFEDGLKSQVNWVLPPALLESTSSDHLWAGLVARFPWTFAQLKTAAHRTICVFNTDSAASCLKVGRSMGELVPTIAAPCRLHQLCIAMVSVLRDAGLTSVMYSTALLLHRRRVQTRLRKALRQHISENLELCFTPPAPCHIEQTHAILDMLKPMLLEGDYGETAVGASHSKRVVAWRRLRQFVHGPIDSVRIMHYCPYKCHDKRQDAVDELVGLLEVVFINSPPTVPAYNKFNKINPPLLWFMVFCSLFGLFPLLMRCTVEAADEDDDLDTTAEGRDAIAVGMADSQAHGATPTTTTTTPIITTADCHHKVAGSM